jgi:NAD+ synthase
MGGIGLKHPEKVAKAICTRMRMFFDSQGFECGVLGVSGGVDSATTLILAVRALGAANVHALLMPEKNVTKKSSLRDARALCEQLAVDYDVIDIAPFLKSFKRLPWFANKHAWINVKPRIRMLLLYGYANAHKALVIGTSNKTELMLGYFTKWGDGSADILPIASLYKTQVMELAEYLGVPKSILQRTPSAELYVGQRDEAELGASYEELDRALALLEQHRAPRTKLEKRIAKMVERNKHKRALSYVVSPWD